MYPYPDLAAQARSLSSPFEQAELELHTLINDLRSSAALAFDHATIETLIHDRGMDILRLVMQGWCNERVAAEPVRDVAGADSIARTHHRITPRRLESVFGAIVIHRDRVGARGAEALAPADAALNLPEDRFSFGVRQRVAEEAVRGSYEQVVASVERSCGADVAKRQAEDLVQRAAVDFDAFYEACHSRYDGPSPSRDTLLVLTVDGKGVVMRPDALRPATQKAAKAAKPKISGRLSKGEKRNRKRMATVAAVYDIAPRPRTPEDIVRELDRQPLPVSPGAAAAAPEAQPSARPPRPRPTNKRVFASIAKSTSEVIGEVFAEAERRDPQHARAWVALVDGNPHPIADLRAAAARAHVKLTLVLDIIHVTEYLWRSAWEFFEEGDSAARAWVDRHQLDILRGRVSTVAASLRRAATRANLKKRTSTDNAADYLLGHKDLMRYDEYLRAGLPIGTGVIEGACRYLIKDRMDITGARWGLEGAEAILRLRSLWASKDLEDYWAFHRKQEFVRNHASRYAANDALWHGRQAA